MDIIMGIDPGLQGGIAWWDGYTMHVNHMPVYKYGKKTFFDSADLACFLTRNRMSFIVIEEQWSFPGQSCVSLWRQAEGYFKILGMVDALVMSHVTVRPKVWKKGVCVTDKHSAYERAVELHPDLKDKLKSKRGKLYDGLADAVMICEYARKVQ